MPPATTTQSQTEDDLIESNERILIIVHKHWIGILGIYSVAVMTLLALGALVFTLLPTLAKEAPVYTYGIAGLLILSITIFLMLMVTYIYRQSQLTLTDKSLVQTIQSTLFNRRISRLSMTNVEDVKVEQRGILPTVFNYGTLTIQTAGEQDNFIFPLCPRPNVYAEKILEARQVYADMRQGVD